MAVVVISTLAQVPSYPDSSAYAILMVCTTIALILATALLVWQSLRTVRAGFYRYARRGTQVG